MKVQRPDEDPAESPRPTRRRIREEIEAPDPAHRPQRDIHRTRPIDAAAPGVARDPITHLVYELARIPLVARQPVRLAQCGEVLAPTQLPGHLHVARAVQFEVVATRGVL